MLELGVPIIQTINDLRLAQGMDIRALGRLAGVHESGLYVSLNGYSGMRISTAEKLLAVLGHELVIVPQTAINPK